MLREKLGYMTVAFLSIWLGDAVHNSADLSGPCCIDRPACWQLSSFES